MLASLLLARAEEISSPATLSVGFDAPPSGRGMV
jgi:hypothetical protein